MPSFNRKKGLFYHASPLPLPRMRATFHGLTIMSAAYLTQTLLSSPHRCMDYLEEKLPRAWVKDEDGPIDGFGCQVPLKGLKNNYIS